ncbi:MAG: hypothetical protein ACRDBG_28250 [Waterburya sp.]
MKYTDKQLIDRVASVAKGFEGWKDGKYLICVRESKGVPNTFDDKAYAFEVVKGVPKFIMVTSCTTHPGVKVLKKFKSLYNRAGAPVFLEDTIVYNSHTYGLHQGKYAAYRQAKIFPYVRDNDADDQAETDGYKIITDGPLPMMNVHRANQARTSSIVDDWSAGCLVMNNPEAFNQWMKFMNKQPLNLCILQEF